MIDDELVVVSWYPRRYETDRHRVVVVFDMAKFELRWLASLWKCYSS